MSEINLLSIFRHVVSDPNFLSVETQVCIDPGIVRSSDNRGSNIMTSMVSEYRPLAPYEVQDYNSFPSMLRELVEKTYVRFGIRNVMEKKFKMTNVSFLTSLNILLRPELAKASLEDHAKNFSLLEDFISHKIHRNYKIDRTKNTKKVQAANQEIIKLLVAGQITTDVILNIVNIFEINLVVFDFTRSLGIFYWTCGTKYPYLNTCRDLHFMAYVQGNYEPITPLETKILPKDTINMYTNIFNKLPEIKCYPTIRLDMASWVAIDSWKIPTNKFFRVMSNLYYEQELEKKNSDDEKKLINIIKNLDDHLQRRN